MRTALLPLSPPLSVVGDADSLDPVVRRARQALPVALVCMPFVSHYRPSLQIGLLKSIAASHGFPVRTFHLNLDFSTLVGPAAYEELCEFGRVSLGDWLFSREAFRADAPDNGSAFLDEHAAHLAPMLARIGLTHDDLLRIRDVDVPLYLDWLMQSVTWANFRVVGFTTTFQQNVSSFALARRIKDEFPATKIMLGGANVEDEMGPELLRSIPWIDHAVIGEADLAFPEFLIAVAEGGDPSTVPGVASRQPDGRVSVSEPRPLFEQLDELPTPDYHEFFERAKILRAFSPGTWRHVRLPYESARGCWWGQRKHCTFCGLNGLGMAYRSKSPVRVRRELDELSRRHDMFAFNAVDNIMDSSYFSDLLPELAREGARYDLFYEIKANLLRQHIALLAAAGVRTVQPGIESLSTHILELMRKGVTAIQNINTLRWCEYYGIEPNWNILYGFPGETEDDYRGQFEFIALIRHLRPPEGPTRIWMERFSPIFTDRAAFPARFVRPRSWYKWIYPPDVDLDKVAYFFDYYFDNVPPHEAILPTNDLVRDWNAAWQREPRPWMTFRPAGGCVCVEDGRRPDNVQAYELRDLAAAIYTGLSDRPLTIHRLMQALELSEDPPEIQSELENLCAAGLTIRDGPLYLSLALPVREGETV